MKPKIRTVRWLSLSALGGLLMTAASSTTAEAAPRCYPVAARIVTQITTENCASPVMLCTKGKVIGGPLSGASAFTTLGVSPGAGLLPLVPATTLSYAGDLTITNGLGTIQLRDVGLLEQGTSRFTELDVIVGGTGSFTGATGRWFISGAVTGGGTGFDGLIVGDLCTP
jgi:hypothetical protein